MKKISIIILLLITTANHAQNDLKEIIKNDNALQLGEYLKDRDVNDCIFIKNSDYNLLALAIKYNAKAVLKDLIEKYAADINKICEDKTPLMYAIKYDREEMVKTLLNAGADHHKKSKANKTVIYYAKKYNRKSIEELLIGFQR